MSGMKGRLASLLLASGLLLSSCTEVENLEYTEAPINVCSFYMGDTVYRCIGSRLKRYNAENPTEMAHFCYDPLCDHSGNDKVCPDCYNLLPLGYSIDGSRIYMYASSFLSALGGGTYNSLETTIYSFKPDGSDMRAELTFDSANDADGGISILDGKLYYQQSFYRDGEGIEDDSQYIKLMSLDLKSGNTAEVLPG